MNVLKIFYAAWGINCIVIRAYVDCKQQTASKRVTSLYSGVFYFPARANKKLEYNTPQGSGRSGEGGVSCAPPVTRRVDRYPVRCVYAVQGRDRRVIPRHTDYGAATTVIIIRGAGPRDFARRSPGSGRRRRWTACTVG